MASVGAQGPEEPVTLRPSKGLARLWAGFSIARVALGFVSTQHVVQCPSFVCLLLTHRWLPGVTRGDEKEGGKKEDSSLADLS